jgi:hypothetical protein
MSLCKLNSVGNSISPQFCSYLNNGKFVSVKRFNRVDSTKIIEFLGSNDLSKDGSKTVIFDTNGSLTLFDNNNRVLEYVNGLTNKGVIANVDGKGRCKLKDNTVSEYFVSPGGNWLLYADVNAKSVNIYYNFFHRKEFADFYDADEDTAGSLFTNYCKTINYKDDACFCYPYDTNLKYNECVNNFFKYDDTRIQKFKKNDSDYQSLQRFCPCLNSSCSSNYNKNLNNDSFIRTKIMAEGTTLNNCQLRNLSFVSCDVNISAGTNMKTGDNNISQNCNSSTSDSSSPAPDVPPPKSDVSPHSSGPPPPDVSSPRLPVPPPPNVSSPSLPVPPPHSSGPPSPPSITSVPTQKSPLSNKYVIGIIVLVIILMIIAIVVIMNI